MSVIPNNITVTICPHDENDQPGRCSTFVVPSFSPSRQPQNPTPAREPVFVGCETEHINSVQITNKGYQVGCARNDGQSTGTVFFKPQSEMPGIMFMPK